MLLPDDIIQLIMVSYHRPNDFQACLASILTNTAEPFRLSIIDNSMGGLDSVLATITDPRITIYRNQSNLGKSRAFMAWYPQIMVGNRNPIFVSLDADIQVPPGWLLQLLRAAYSAPRLGVLAPVLVRTSGDTLQQQLNRNELVMHRTDQFSTFITPLLYYNRQTAGPVFIIDRAFFDSVGGYAHTQLYGNDDGWLCATAQAKHRFVGIATAVEVVHLEQDVTDGYRAWKARNINGDVDYRGFWDQSDNHDSID